jgi:predicted nucleic acid-binding protein
MTITGAKTQAKIFIDTNIVLRAIHNEIPLHANAKRLLGELYEQDNELWISRHIIREYIVQVTRPGFLSKTLTGHQVEAQVATLKLMFKIADETEAVTAQLVQLLKRFRVVASKFMMSILLPPC